MQVDVVEREIRFLLLLHLTDGLEPKHAIRILRVLGCHRRNLQRLPEQLILRNLRFLFRCNHR